jgi:arginine-tRNA-protein transferase
MRYYLRDQLIAIGVIDITSEVLSSVYFFYDPMFEDLNVGTFGALLEIEWI